MRFANPQVVLFTRDIERAVSFYAGLGFQEVFRVPADGHPVHVDLELDGYRLGLVTEQTSRDEHGLDPLMEGQRAVVVLWSDDTPAAYAYLQELGARPMSEPHPFMGRLIIAWAQDPDGHPIQVVQEMPGSAAQR